MKRLRIARLTLAGWIGLLAANPAAAAGESREAVRQAGPLPSTGQPVIPSRPLPPTGQPLPAIPPGSAGGSSFPVRPAGPLPSTGQPVLPSEAPADPGLEPLRRARAGQWNFATRAAGTLTFTNNIGLAPPGQEQSDLVLETALPLGVRRAGSRMKFLAEYIPTVYVYARNSDSNYLQNNLRSLLSVEPIDDFLIVDAFANSYPTYVSPFLARPESGASITENRTQQTTLGLSPYLRRETARGWSYLLRNDSFYNTYDDSELADSFATRVSANLESPPTRLNYGFDYAYFYSRDQSQANGYYQQIARLRPMFRATRELSVSARIGYETNDYTDQYSGSVYGVGSVWTPTPRTKLDGFLEHRFFGESYSLVLNHRARRTAWRLSGSRNTYTTIEQPLSQRPATTAELLNDTFRARIADPLEREQAVRQFLESVGLPASLTQPYTFYTDQVYVSEQWTGSVALLGRRNTVELAVFWQKNEPITAGGNVLPGVAGFEQFHQQSVTLNFSHRLTASTNVVFGASRLYTQSVDPSAVAADELESIQDTLRLTLTHRLSQKTDGSIGLRWANFDSETEPYREVAVLAGVVHSF